MDKLVRMKMHKLLLLAVACTWAMGATAQWQWTDKDGRKVFSDRVMHTTLSAYRFG